MVGVPLRTVSALEQRKVRRSETDQDGRSRNNTIYQIYGPTVHLWQRFFGSRNGDACAMHKVRNPPIVST